MPLVVLNAVDAAGVLACLDHDLKFLLNEAEVPADVQAAIAHARVRKLGVFAKLASTEDAMRQWISDDLGLPADNAAARVTHAALLDVWETARDRVTVQRRVDNEARASGMHKQMHRSSHLALRRKLFSITGDVPDHLLPSRSYIDMRLEQVEEGELRPEKLSEVITVRDEDDEVADQLSLDLQRTGQVKIRKGKTAVDPPKTTEELRRVYTIMGHHWYMVALKNPTVNYLDGMTLAVWAEHVQWLLAEDVWGVEARDGSGNIVALPSWLTLLGYEFQLRKKACKLVNNSDEGLTLAAALKTVRASTELRERYFTTPMAVSAKAERGAGAGHRAHSGEVDEAGLGRGAKKPRLEASRGEERRTGKVSLKKNKKSAKEKEDSAPNWFSRAKRQADSQLHTNTPDGKEICFRFQSGKCASDQCSRAHVCAKCLGPKPYQTCDCWRK